MTVRLEAWLDGSHAGQFIFDDNPASVRFEYASNAPETPISLSLPRRRAPTRRAARNFLENLLPDHEATRARMASAYGAESTHTADLLAQAGGDLAGGLVVLPEGEQIDQSGHASLNPALDRDIAERISSIKIDPDAWAPRGGPARFSLAGTQGKFALALVDDEWYWSNSSVPSTHILKPGRPDLRGLECAEAAALALAARMGIPAPRAAVLDIEDQTAFVVERFDREPGKLFARRRHTEDLAQALGVGHDAKYQISARQIAELLVRVDADSGDAGGSLLRAFTTQLVFNTLIGNADAHAKNYSVLISAEGVQFAPIYDAVPVSLYPEHDQRLAMRIAGARLPQAARPAHWRKFARTIGFDEEEMVGLVGGLAERVADLNDTAWDGLERDQRQQLRTYVARNTAVALDAVQS